MKVIFLDIDGVLNSVDYMNVLHMLKHGVGDKSVETSDHHGQLFDPRCVKFLDYIVQMTGAKIVITSTWRRAGLKAMQDLWDERDLPGEVIAVTCSSYEVDGEIIDRNPYQGRQGVCRGHEIQQWLNDNKLESYVILDDDSDMLPDQHFVKCNGRYGIDFHVAKAAINYLNFKEDGSEEQ